MVFLSPSIENSEMVPQIKTAPFHILSDSYSLIILRFVSTQSDATDNNKQTIEFSKPSTKYLSANDVVTIFKIRIEKI